MSLEWKEPPAACGGTRVAKWAAVAAELRARPGVWALVSTRPTPGSASQNAAALRGGRYAGFVSGEFEAKARGVEVYARYVGKPKLTAAERAS